MEGKNIQEQISEVSQKLQNASIDSIGLPKRPIPPTFAPGSQTCQVYTNSFRFFTPKNAAPVNVYSFNFEPPINQDSRRAIRSLVNQKRQEIITAIGRYIVSGQNLFAYSGKQPVTEQLNYEVKLGESTHTLFINFANKRLDMNSQNLDPSVEQYLNILWKQILKALNLQEAGRVSKYFDSKQSQQIPEYKISIWPGYQTAIHKLSGGVFLQVDVVHRILRDDTALQFMNDIYGQMRGNQEQARKLIHDELVGKSIVAAYGNFKFYQVTDIDFNVTPLSTFKKGETEMTFKKYYQDTYQIQITNNNQPLLVSKQRRGGQVIYLIPELCKMTSLTDESRRNFQLMQQIAQHTRIDPNTRMVKTQNLIKNAQKNAQQLLTDFGVDFDPNPIQCNAYQVPPTTILLTKPNKVDNVVGNFNLRGTILHPQDLEVWLFIYDKRDANNAENLLQELRRQAQSFGIGMSEPKKLMLGMPPSNDQEMMKTIENNLQRPQNGQKGTQILFFFLPDSYKRFKIYEKTKLLCTNKYPIPSQFLLTNSLKNPKRIGSICGKVVLQMNCKVGGALWQIPKEPALQNNPYAMICGIDVTHDTITREKSVLGFVASIDPNFTSYYSCMEVQDVGQEISSKISNCLISALQAF